MFYIYTFLGVFLQFLFFPRHKRTKYVYFSRNYVIKRNKLIDKINEANIEIPINIDYRSICSDASPFFIS